MQEDKELQNNGQDDLDIEIVTLDNQTLNEKRVSRSSRSSRFSPRQRSAQAIVTISVVLLALMIIVASNGAIRDKFVPPPTPTEAIPVGTDRFYVNADPGWGHLFVDGKLIEHVPYADNNSPPIRLSRGTHILQWDAVPFPRQTCTVSVPPKYRMDTCEYNSLLSNGKDSGWQFSFPAKFVALSEAQQQLLIAAVQAALQQYTSTDSIQPGEVYVTDDLSGKQTIAREPLKATLHYELDTDLSSQAVCGPSPIMGGARGCMYINQDCRNFCTASEYFNVSPLVSRTWNVFAAARVVWDYTTLTGKPILQHHVEMFIPGIAHEYLLPIQISWDGTSLHTRSTFSLLSPGILQGFTSPLCDAALNQVDRNPSLRGIYQPTYVSTFWNYVAAPNTVSGCLGVVTLDQSQTTQPAEAPALCLYHFGVFRAANNVAHKYWPTMPLANAFEQQLAQQLHEASMSTPTG